MIAGETDALHLLPMGILTPGVVPVIGNGVVVDLNVLFDEIDLLTSRGIDTTHLVVSADAHVIPFLADILHVLPLVFSSGVLQEALETGEHRSRSG